MSQEKVWNSLVSFTNPLPEKQVTRISHSSWLGLVGCQVGDILTYATMTMFGRDSIKACLSAGRWRIGEAYLSQYQHSHTFRKTQTISHCIGTQWSFEEQLFGIVDKNHACIIFACFENEEREEIREKREEIWSQMAEWLVHPLIGITITLQISFANHQYVHFKTVTRLCNQDSKT